MSYTGWYKTLSHKKILWTCPFAIKTIMIQIIYRSNLERLGFSDLLTS